MLVKQWQYEDFRIDLYLVGSDYISHIYEPGSVERIEYTPVIEMKHGEVKAEKAAEAFVDERRTKKNPAK